MSTTRKYAKKAKEVQKGETPFNEIRITGTDYVGKYITYAASLLVEGREVEGDKKEEVERVILKATGVATKGACLVAEILKHRIFGLHQLNKIETITVFDEYEPLEEGLDEIKIERKLAVFEIHLSKKDGVLDTKAPGYQAPLPKNQVQEEDLTDLLKRREGGGRRGGDRGDREDRGERRGGRRGGRRGDRRGGRGGRGGRRGGERRDYEDRREGGERRERREYDDRREGGERRGGRGGRRGGYGERRDYEDRREGGEPRERREYGERRGGYGERREYDDRREGGERRGGRRGGERRGGERRGGERRGGERRRGGDRGDY